MDNYCQECFLIGIICTSRSRQYLTGEGTGAVYMNPQYYTGLLNMALSGAVDDTHNILLNNLFTVMSSLEMVSVLGFLQYII